jgi:hypothetical protein
VTQQSDVPALEIVVKRPTRPPSVGVEQAASTACGEGGYLDASSVSAEHGQFIGPQFGITEPGRPMWILTFHDICEPFHGPPNFEPPQPCAATEGFVLVDSTTGEFFVSLSGPSDL